jgi:hypothetical protein
MAKQKINSKIKAKTMVLIMKNEIIKMQSEISNEDLRGLRYRLIGFIECMNMFKEYYGNYLSESEKSENY